MLGDHPTGATCQIDLIHIQGDARLWRRLGVGRIRTLVCVISCIIIYNWVQVAWLVA